MFDDHVSALFADLEATIAALPVSLHPRDHALLDELDTIRPVPENSQFDDDKISAEPTIGEAENSQKYKGCDRDAHDDGQCAFTPTSTPSSSNPSTHPHGAITTTSSISPYIDTPRFTHVSTDTPSSQNLRRADRKGIARARSTTRATRNRRTGLRASVSAWRSAASRHSTLPSRGSRKLRRSVSCVETFMHKRWRDLSPVEKFCLSVRHVANAGGRTFSLNMGVRREGMLLDHDDPRLRMRDNLARHLRAAGFGELPIAWIFEATKGEHPRLHLHGVVDTAGLADADLLRLDRALCKAASPASGAIGGERQADMRPITDAAGWADYLLEDLNHTADLLRLDVPDLFTINHAMTRQVRDFYDQLRDEGRAASS